MAKAEDIRGLDCEASVLDGAGLVLRARLEEMCALRANALNWDDIEGVHDMRVASRRLRSALLDFTPYLRKRVSQKRLKSIASALGAVRDEDVAIVALKKLRTEVTADVGAGIEQIMEERRARRQRARLDLERAIAEESLAKLQTDFVARLERATRRSNGKRARGGNGSLINVSFRQAGRDTVLARFEELQSLSGSLYRPCETEPLHRMRIAAKKLRYAIELFAPCWGAQLASFAQEVAELQKSLGELHDCDVWIADVGARLLWHQRAEANDVADAYSRERRAAIWLLRYFVKERTRHFRDALARWHEWETNDFSPRLVESLDAINTSIELQPVMTLS